MSDNSTAAFLFIPDLIRSSKKILGLTVLERTLFALEKSGIAKVIIKSDSKERVNEILRKNKDLKIEFTFLEGHIYPELNDKVEGLLVLSEPLVIDQNILVTLLNKGKDSVSIIRTDDCKIIWLSNSIFRKSTLKVNSFEEIIEVLKSSDYPIETFNNNGLMCLSISDSQSVRQSEYALIRGLTKPTDGWVSRNLNRPVSTRISRVLAHTRITPNQFTVFTGILGLSTAFFLIKGGYWNYLIGGFLFHLTSVLDGVDGELARLKFKSSPMGQWLDTVADNLSYLAALSGMIIGLYIHGASKAVYISAFLAVIFAVLALGSLYFYLLRFKSGGTLLNVKYGFQGSHKLKDRIIQIAGAFGKRDLFALVFLILAVFGKMPWALIYIAIMAFFVFAFSIQAHIIASRQIK